jgi:hypothetical protein
MDRFKRNEKKEKALIEWCEKNLTYNTSEEMEEKIKSGEVFLRIVPLYDKKTDEVYAVHSYLTDGEIINQMVDSCLLLKDINIFPEESKKLFLSEKVEEGKKQTELERLIEQRKKDLNKDGIDQEIKKKLLEFGLKENKNGFYAEINCYNDYSFDVIFYQNRIEVTYHLKDHFNYYTLKGKETFLYKRIEDFNDVIIKIIDILKVMIDSAEGFRE